LLLTDVLCLSQITLALAMVLGYIFADSNYRIFALLVLGFIAAVPGVWVVVVAIFAYCRWGAFNYDMIPFVE